MFVDQTMGEFREFLENSWTHTMIPKLDNRTGGQVETRKLWDVHVVGETRDRLAHQ